MNRYEEAIFAMGCFWCGATAFLPHEINKEHLGIYSVRSGYAGGTIMAPTYEYHPGYREAVKIIFNPKEISYTTLLSLFWHNIDPFDSKGQFCDQGFSYTSAIYCTNSSQLIQAQESKKHIEKMFNKKISTEILEATTFFDAEEYHQNYHLKNPVQYQGYRCSSNRDSRLQEIWGKRVK